MQTGQMPGRSNNMQAALTQKTRVNTWQSLTGLVAFGALAAAMVGSIFSSDAWNQCNLYSWRGRNPKRNIGLSLFLGTRS
jgi:APA family basic amino acid/polyamine antiporter